MAASSRCVHSPRLSLFAVLLQPHKDLLARDEHISQQLSEMAGDLAEVVLTEVGIISLWC